MLILFLDYKKAFDTLDHRNIMHSLQVLGVTQRVERWFDDYLENREITVKINKTFSIPRVVPSGVPQGSNLGPILYLLQVVSMPLAVEKTKIFQYADDTILVAESEDFLEAQGKLQHDFVNILKWSHDHGLVLNETKTSVMHVRPPMQPKFEVAILSHNFDCLHSSGVDCKCNNFIQQVEVQKYLGVYIDECFKWEPHVDSLCRRLRSSTFGLYSLSRIVTKKTLITVYKAMVESVLRYGLLSFGEATETNLGRVRNIQKSMLKIIHGKVEIRKPNLFKFYEVLPIEKLFFFVFILTYFFKQRYKTAIPQLRDRREAGAYKTYLEPRYTNNFGKKELRCSVPRYFNELPSRILELTTYNEAKRTLREWLFSNMNDFEDP